MPAGWFIGWIGVLAVLGAMAIAPRRTGRGALLPQFATAMIVLLLSGMALHRARQGREPSLEAWRIRIGAGEEPVTLGTDPACDVTLLDPHGAAVHGVIRFTDQGPTLQSLTPDRRLEINGIDIHHVPLETGSALELGGRTWTVVEQGALLPRVDLRDPNGAVIRLTPSPLRRMAGAVPLIGDRFEVGVAELTLHLDGEVPGSREARLVSLARSQPRGTRLDTAPTAEIALRGRLPLLRFPTPADRHASPVVVHTTDGTAARPADRPVPVRSGDHLTLGYTTYEARVDADGTLELTVVGAPPRRTFVPAEGLLVVGPGGDLPWATGRPVVLQVSALDDEAGLGLISTDPAWHLDERRGYAWLHRDDQEVRDTRPVTLSRGSGLIVSGDRHEEVFRYRTPTAAATLLRGAEPGTPEARLVRAGALCALLYLALTAVLWRRGYLHADNAALFHGPALLLGVGLAVLADLSPAGDPRQAHVVVRQAEFAAGGLATLLLVTIGGWLWTRGQRDRERGGGLVAFLERPLLAGRLRGRLGTISRVWVLWFAATALLLLQLPFGEQGLRLPWLGSLLPVEGAKTLLAVFVAFLGVRALEDKRFRLRGTEGLRSRWAYMLHAVPILGVAGLCFGLDDISPVLVLGAFLWVMYLITLLRPARAFWPPRAWLQNVYLEQVALLGVAAAVLAVLIRADSGTVAERLDVWLDPWQHTATSPQFVEALWAMLDGGLFGRGFGTPLAHVPPAAHDDFVLAVLGNRAGLVGIALVGVTCAAVVTGGLWAAGRAIGSPASAGNTDGRLDRSRMLATAAVLMFGIQVLLVFASVLGRAPVMGQPLPFLAAGGSHLLLFCLPTVALALVATRRATGLEPARAVAPAPWFRRAVLLLGAVGMVATGGLGLRLIQLERAAGEHRRMHLAELPVDDLGGGIVIRPVRKGYRLVRGPGLDHRLADGETLVAGTTTLVFHQLDHDGGKVEILAEPLRVFAARETDSGPRGGFHRIDVGGDPLGAAGGTRDRIYVDHRGVRDHLPAAARSDFDRTRGVAHLVPADGDVFRLDHDHFRVVAEVEGLTRVRGERDTPLAPGTSADLLSGDRLVGPGFDLEVVLEDRTRAVPVTDADGAVVGHRGHREPTLVVFSRGVPGEAAGRRAYLTCTDRSGAAVSVPLPDDRPTLLYGALDRLLPLRGRVIPAGLRSAELLADFDRGLELGAIRMHRGFIGLDEGTEARHRLDDEIGRTAGRQLLEQFVRFNRGEVPATVTVAGQVGEVDLARAAGWSLRTDGGVERPAVGMQPVARGLQLAPPGDLSPADLPPGQTVRWTLVRTLTGTEEQQGELVVAADVPVLVLLDGQLLAAVRGDERAVPLPLSPGEHTLELQARFTGRARAHGEVAGVRVRCAAAEHVAFHGGRQRFVGWTDRADRGRLWAAVAKGEHGYHWLAETPPSEHDVTGFFQVLLDTPAAGQATLALATAGYLEGAWLNGQPLPAVDLPYLPGEEADVPVSLRRGSNLLALRVRQPAATPTSERNGVRLVFDGGALVGLHPHTGEQRRGSIERRGRRTPRIASAPGRASSLVVVRGAPGLEEGTSWLVHGQSLLWLPTTLDDIDQPVLELDDGLVLHADPGAADPFRATNRSGRSAEAFRQIDPMRRPYRPFGGFRVADGWAHPLQNDRDALRLGDRQVTYRRGDPAAIEGHVVIARDDGVHRLVVDAGPGGIEPVPPATEADHLLVTSTRDTLQLLHAAQGTAVYRGGALHAAVGATVELPLELAPGDAISCPSSGLLLVAGGAPGESLGLGDLRTAADTLSRGRVRRGEAPSVELTLHDDLQRLAAAELAAQVALADAIHADAGLEVLPGPDGLRGAVLVMDTRDGSILASAAEGEDADAADAWRLAWFRPGSTFKIVTSLTALHSTDPEVADMLDGELPEGLIRGAPGSLAGARLSRAAPGDGRWAGRGEGAIRLRSRLSNFRRDPVAPGTDLEAALASSYNVYFGYLALLLHRPLREGWPDTALAAHDADLVPLAAMARRLGFGQVLDLVPAGAGQEGGRVGPLRDARGRPVSAGDALVAWTGDFPDGRLDEPRVAACGVGQDEVQTTPLQLARVVSALANGGRLVQPTVIAAVDGRPAPPDPAVDLDLDPVALDRVRAGLARVVSEGTAATTFGDNPHRDRIWGKTGSAERATGGGGLVTDSWFAGVLEAEAPGEPAIAVVCVMPGAGLGGTHAAEVVDRIMRYHARTRSGAAATAVASNER